jgi:hypothetical protein
MTCRRLMICMFIPSMFETSESTMLLVDDVHDLWSTRTSKSTLQVLTSYRQASTRRERVLQSCGTKCDKPHESLSASSRVKTSHRVFRARSAAAYHGAAFRIWQIPSRRSLARLALAMMGTGDGRAELGVGWMLVLLGVLAIDSWQGRAGMTAAVSYARGRLLARAWQAWLLRLCAVTTKARRARQQRQGQAQGDCQGQPPCHRVGCT